MATDGVEHFPIVDFSCLQLGVDQPELRLNDDRVKEIAKQILDGFTRTGFVYLKNHGVPEKLIDKVWGVADEFFTLPEDVKMKYRRPEKGEGNDGWISLERENLNPQRPVADYKEAFNVASALHFPENRLVEEVSEFKPAIQEAFEACTELGKRVLDAICVAMELKDSQFLRDCHSSPASNTNSSTLRILYYPKIGPEVKIQPGQVRCGEHSDYSSITLLWQGSKGLEVQTVDGEYVLAPPVPGTVLVNIGDLMQRWTADRLRAAKHRVLINEEDIKQPKVRKSMAFFFHPDDDTIVECLDGSNKYPPISAFDYLIQKLVASY